VGVEQVHGLAVAGLAGPAAAVHEYLQAAAAARRGAAAAAARRLGWPPRCKAIASS